MENAAHEQYEMPQINKLRYFYANHKIDEINVITLVTANCALFISVRMKC